MEKSNRKHKKRDTDKILTIIIVSVLTVLLSVSYIRKTIMLNDFKLTTCSIIDTRNESGLSSGLEAKIMYYVDDTKYIHYVLAPSRKYRIGEKYKLKYSIKIQIRTKSYGMKEYGRSGGQIL